MSLTRKNVIVKRLKNSVKKYFSQTTLHGFRYITQPESSTFKSCFWSLVCLTSVCLCFSLIYSQFYTYNKNRITTSISTTAFPIREVPFPAVTLCNFNVVYQNNIEQFRSLLVEQGVFAYEIDNFFANLSAMIPNNWYSDSELNHFQDFSKIIKILKSAGYDTELLMEKLSQPCDQLVTGCYWNLKQINCAHSFQMIKTNRGFCCSFNYRALDANTTQNKQIYVSGVGPSFGLKVHLSPESEQYVAPFKQGYGIDVAIHENIQYPDFSIYATTITPGSSVSLAVKPEITESDEQIRQVDLETRGCAFQDEVAMVWTSTYSYSTCINECKAKALIELCNCLPFYYYHRKKSHGKIRSCTYLDLTCLNSNKKDFNLFLFEDSAINKKILGDTVTCNCFPQCNEVTYSYQIDQQPAMDSNTSILSVYFGHVSCMKMKRSIVITWELVIASIGGLIGLCLGGSILSVIEFFYHVIEAVFLKYPNGTQSGNKHKKKRDKNKRLLHTPRLYWNEVGINFKEN